MPALGYPPHVTFAVYDTISETRLRDALRLAFARRPPIRLRFSKLSYFEAPDLVFWAAPDSSDALLQVHAALHRSIEPSLCHAHYRPTDWIPHCTLATDVSPAKKTAAIARASRAIDPFEVVFDAADCAEFYPVRVIDEASLIEPGWY